MVVGVVGEAGAVERHIGEQKQPQSIFRENLYVGLAQHLKTNPALSWGARHAP